MRKDWKHQSRRIGKAPRANAICVLVSGGLDSCVLLGMMAQRFKDIYPVYIRCGLRWEAAEIYWLKKYLSGLHRRTAASQRGGSKLWPKRNLHPLVILEVPVFDVYGSHWSLPASGRNRGRGAAARSGIPGKSSHDAEVYLPGRNLLLLSKAAVFCAQQGISSMAMGQLQGNPFPDATPKFLKLAEKTISIALDRPIRVFAPFRVLSKAKVIQLGMKLGLPLHQSFSCLAPTPRHQPCGECNKCAERGRGLSLQ